MTITTEQLKEIFAKIINELEPSLSKKEKTKLAINRNTSSETLDRLANDEEWVVRYYIAVNPITPPEVLERLSNDKDLDVRRNVAKNPNTPSEALDRLANDEDSGVRYYVAKNPNTSPETLNRMADDTASGVRCGVAENPNFQNSIAISLTVKEFNALKKLIDATQDEVLKSLSSKL